jgi:hypothetical protein
MNKLNLSLLATALALSTSAFAGEGNKPATTGQAPTTAGAPATVPATDLPTAAPVEDKPMTHGQTVSQTAQTTQSGEAVSTVAHSVRDFKKLDMDKDGFITQTDISTDTELTAQFNDWDDDKDLKLSQSEYDAYIASTVAPEEDEPEEEAE